jgi:hypothetical protein
MARCGVCGGKIGRTIIKHGEICIEDKPTKEAK